MEFGSLYCSTSRDTSFHLLYLRFTRRIDRIPPMERGIPVLYLGFSVPTAGPPAALAGDSDAGLAVRLAFAVYPAVMGILHRSIAIKVFLVLLS